MAGTVPPEQLPPDPPPGPPGRPSRRPPWRRRRNPLRRRTDELRVWIGLGVLLAVLAVAPVVTVVVSHLAHRHYEDTARHQNLTRYETTATLTADAPRHPEPGSDEEEPARYPVEVRFTTREGRIGTTRAEVLPGLPAGSPVRIWVTADGEATGPPLTRAEIRSRSTGWALLSGTGVVLVGAGAHGVTRLVVRRRNLADWDRAWAETSPRWTAPG
ncbi:Rv1733c family protein [Streptomyces sp. NPDC055186]